MATTTATAYLLLYIFCDRYLLATKLRRSNIDASKGAVEEVERIMTQIRKTRPRVHIILRADSGFAREALMAWCVSMTVESGPHVFAQKGPRFGVVKGAAVSARSGGAGLGCTA